MFRVDLLEIIFVLSSSACGAISVMGHLAQAVESESCDKKIKVDSCLWQFLKMLDTENECKHWVHPINQDRDVVYFLSGPKSDLK